MNRPGHVTGHLTAASPIRFYIMTDASFRAYEVAFQGPVCSPEDAASKYAGISTIISEGGILNYSFDVQLSVGNYDFVFYSGDYPKPQTHPSINVDFQAITGQTITTLSQLVFSTITQSVLLTTTIPTQVHTQVAQSSFPSGGNIVLIFGVLGGVLIAASVLVLKKRKGGPTTVVQSKEVPMQTLKAPIPTPSSEPNIQTGYGELDNMLKGGLPEGYSIVLVSPSFDESDLLVRRTIASSVASGRPTFYVSKDIAKTRDLINRFGQNFYALNPLADKIATDRDNLFKIPDVGDLSNLNISSNQIIESKAKNEQGKIIVLDLLTDLLLRNKAPTTRRWLTDFAARRKADGFTILATLDPSGAPPEEIRTIVGAFDGVIEVYEKPLQERSRRFLIIKKMYGRDYSENELMLDKHRLL
jgi:KaiC/GvpD/RAD55 family RecA-like ATPase